MTLKLRDVANGSVFAYNGVIWKKGDLGNNVEAQCTPKYGGQWQENLKKFIGCRC